MQSCRLTGDRILVQVRVLPWFSDLLAPGRHRSLLLEEELPAGSSLRVLLAGLAERYAGFGTAIYDAQGDALRETVVVTHNGRLVSPAGVLDLPLQSGDTVALIPAYAGG